MLIAIDIDSTIYPMVPEWIELYNRKTGDDLRMEDVDDYLISKSFTKLTLEESYELLDHVRYEGDVYPDSKRTICQLIDEGHEIVFHSAVFNSIQAQNKLRMLNRVFGDSEWDAIFGQGHERKLRYLNHHADVVIEDSLHSIRFVTVHNPDARVFLVNQNWNRNANGIKMDNVTRVDSWAEIRRHLGLE